jgi:cell division protein FtsI/penicillin-binding protein 2
METQISKNWIRAFSLGVALLSLGIITRLYFVQIVSGSEFEIASSRQISVQKEDKDKDRGSIIFKYKDGKDFYAAINKTGYSIEINPQIIKNPADTYNILSNYIELEPDEFLAQATKEDDSREIIATKVPIDIAQKISNIELKGVSLRKEKWRFYPGKHLAAQVLGFISYRGDEIRGQYGLERVYEKTLSKDNKSLYANFFVELFSGIQDSVSGEKGDGSIVTTIEPNVQTLTEEIVAKITEDYHSKKSGAIVMDPETGEIIAMVVHPSFDVNIFNESEDISIFQNDIVENVYEMGSIIKPLSMAIGLDTGAINKDSTYEDRGSLTFNNRTFYNYDKKARGVVEMQEILNQSLNTGATHISQKVGKETFADYMKKLLGSETGIDLPNEAAPLVDNLDTNRDLEIATASFGQGVAISPISAIRALASLGNGGVLVTPRIAKEVKYDLGIVDELKKGPEIQVFKSETSTEISRMLTRVVDEALLGGEVALPNYSIAAKTGTAQIVDMVNGGYFENRFLHSFFGYFPSYNPEFIILLYTIEPQGVQYASRTLTEPFMDIVKYLINYYEVEPDR